MGKKYGTLVICAVILFLFFGGTASAKTWYVDDDDRADFETIQGAIFDRNVTDRDTIIVRAGTYIENVEVNKSLTIQSDRGAEVTTVRANDPHEFIFKVCANYVKISGYKIEGSALPGIELCYGTNHCNISNNYCTDCDIGIALDKSNNNSISNNHCISNRDNAIDLDYSHNNSITNNICTHNIGNGIDLSNSYYNSITNNTCSLNVDSGIYLDNSNNNSIMNNTCKDSMRDSIDLWFSNNNHIYLNNFVTETGDFNCFNSINVWNTTEKVTYRYNGSMYRNYLGNYWGDRIRTDAEGEGICDDPFIIDCDQDNYPLMMPFENYIINRSSLKETTN